MAKKSPTHQLLTASIDLESKTTPERQEHNETLMKWFPERAAKTRIRSCFGTSLPIVERLARYLSEEVHMTCFLIRWGYLIDKEQWQIFIVFGDEDMTDEGRVKIRKRVLSLLDNIQPETDMVVKGSNDVPVRLVTKWYIPKGWRHLTEIMVQDGRLFLPTLDSKDDLKEIKAYEGHLKALGRGSMAMRVLDRLNEAVPSVIGPLYNLVNKDGESDENVERAELTLDKAMSKIRQSKQGRVTMRLGQILPDTP